MVVTVLIENTLDNGDSGLAAEHGLSLHVRHGDRSILFDTGASGRFLANARKLDVDIGEVDLAVVSHGHYDHGGGLDAFFTANTSARVPVYLKQGADGDFFSGSAGVKFHYIGLDKTVLQVHKKRVKIVDSLTEIADDIFVVTDLTGGFPLPRGNRRLFKREGNRYVPDGFSHELMMVIKVEGEMVLFTGCSHNGILNMLQSARRHFPGCPIRAVFGGFHLVGFPFKFIVPEKRAELHRIADSLLDQVVGKVYTAHCTGERSYRRLKKNMGGSLMYIRTGWKIDL